MTEEISLDFLEQKIFKNRQNHQHEIDKIKNEEFNKLSTSLCVNVN